MDSILVFCQFDSEGLLTAAIGDCEYHVFQAPSGELNCVNRSEIESQVDRLGFTVQDNITWEGFAFSSVDWANLRDHSLNYSDCPENNGLL